MSRYIDIDDFFRQFPELNTEPYNNISTIFTQEDIDNVLELSYISGQQHPERPKDASNYSEGWMDGYNHAIDQIFEELNYLLKNHVIEELRKRIKR